MRLLNATLLQNSTHSQRDESNATHTAVALGLEATALSNPIHDFPRVNVCVKLSTLALGYHFL